MIEPLYNFNLTEAQEAHARELHDSSIVLDMLFREYYRRNKEQCEDHRRRIAEAVAEHHV